MKQNNIDYEAEYFKIKKNNRSLAKALAEQQQLTKKYQDETTLLQKKLYNSTTLNMQYEKTINELLKYAKNNLEKCVELTNNFSESLVLCHEGSNLKKTFDSDNDLNDLYKVNLRSNSPGSHKTQAVKPMVSGHVIHHPTINLSRLTETRITGAVENSVQNHNSAPENNHTNTNSHTSLTRLPIQGFQGYLGDSDISSDDSINNDDELMTTERTSTPPLSRSLGPLLEVSDEDSRSPNSSITKEVRIMLEPLNITSRTKTVTFREDKVSSRKRPQDDPLEGTSTMLDHSGNLAESKHASKRMCVERLENESDSEESTCEGDRKNRSKFVTKRKSLTEKKDITGQKYKVKRNKSDNKENNSADDTLDRTNEGDHSNNSIEDGEFTNERRSRRLTPRSLAEPSLKMKMRR